MPATKAHDIAAVVGAIDPQSANNTTLTSDWVDMSKFKTAAFVLSVGTTDCTVAFKLVEAKDSSATGAQDLSGKAITSYTATDDNKQAVISVNDTDLTVNTGYGWVRASITLSNATAGLVSLVAIGLQPRFSPASDNKHADCFQTV
jgi:hypothetical protein